MNTVTKLPIPNGTTDSLGLSSIWGVNPTRVGLGFAEQITIQAPSALTGVCTIQTSATNADDTAGVVWSTLQSGGADVAVAAGKSITLPRGAGFKDLRIHSASAEGAQRDFYVTLQVEM